MFSRRAELDLGRDPLGEVLAIGVLPEYLTPEFVRTAAVRIGDELVAHAAAYVRRAGADRMRMVVEAHNKPALLFYHRLGGRFEPYEHAGEPMVHVWFDLHGSAGSTAEVEAPLPGGAAR
jgi:ribosomal protein S18 acetylase RimI-like enzyme